MSNITTRDSKSLQGVGISSTTPTSGQTLTYNSSTQQWEPLTDVIGGQVTQVSATNLVSTTSTTYVLLPGMTITPVAGTYKVTFSARMVLTNKNNQVFFTLFSGGTQILHSERQFSVATNGNAIPASTQATVVVNGAQAIEAHYRGDGASVEATNRSLIIERVL